MDWGFCPWTNYLPVTSIPTAFYVAGIQTHVHIHCWDYRFNRSVCGTLIRRDRPVTNGGFLGLFQHSHRHLPTMTYTKMSEVTGSIRRL